MENYRFFCLDKAGMDVASEWIKAGSDDEAIAFARHQGRHSAKCELWLRNRLALSFQADPTATS